MSEQDDIASVLAGYQPVDSDSNEHAAETMNSVRELLETRKEIEEVGELLESTVDVGVIKPGDTVIFSTEGRITMDQAEELKARIREELPGVKPVILMGVHIEGVYRDEEEE